MTSGVLQMSLADVARIAGVERPVASMWRRRELAGNPFPQPVAVVGAQERFDAFEIADYLAATGRGTNKVEREDVAAHATLIERGGLDQRALFDGLTALLALDVLTGEPLAELSADQLRELAHQVDPHDTLLAREVDALGPAVADVASYAAALADASFSPGAAFELLLRQRLHRGLREHAAVAHRPDAIRLGGQVAASLASHAGWTSPLFVDVTDGSADLLLETVRAFDESATVATIATDTPAARLVRRRISVHDLHRVDATLGEDGDFQLPAVGHDGTVHVLQLPPVAPGGLSDVALLDVVDDVLVQLGGESRMVVVGPASALTDPPTSPDADRARDAVLRSGRLRAAIRLPAGLLVTQPRRHLALWALGPAHPDVPIGDRWTVVGDVSTGELDDSTTADVVTDVLAAMAGPRDAIAHAYRFARPVVTATLIAGRGSLTARPRRTTDVRAVTTGEALDRRLCRLVPGCRVAAADLVADGRPVIGPDELLGARRLGSRAVDPLTFPAAYPAARYTEPGDVIFCTTPRIAARVDRDGGSVVLSPARVLRVGRARDRETLIPDVITADINAAVTKAWRDWTLRLVPHDRHEELRRELDRMADEREQLLTRITELDSRQRQLINDATRTPPEGR